MFNFPTLTAAAFTGEHNKERHKALLAFLQHQKDTGQFVVKADSYSFQRAATGGFGKAIRAKRDVSITIHHDLILVAPHQYAILSDEVVGEGGFGKVVAIKQILTFGEDPTEDTKRQPEEKIKKELKLEEVVLVAKKQRGIRKEIEAEAKAQNAHTNVKAVVPDADGNVYIVMNRIQGIPLSDFLAQYKPSFEDRVQIAYSICDYVAKIHNRQRIHCDLKPPNFIIDPKTLIITPIDFGMARETDDRGVELKPGVRGGTRGYCDPDMLDEKINLISTAVDVYSMGLILAEVFGCDRKKVLRKKLKVKANTPIDDQWNAWLKFERAGFCFNELDRVLPTWLDEKIPNDEVKATLTKQAIKQQFDSIQNPRASRPTADKLQTFLLGLSNQNLQRRIAKMTELKEATTQPCSKEMYVSCSNLVAPSKLVSAATATIYTSSKTKRPTLKTPVAKPPTLDLLYEKAAAAKKEIQQYQDYSDHLTEIKDCKLTPALNATATKFLRAIEQHEKSFKNTQDDFKNIKVSFLLARLRLRQENLSQLTTTLIALSGEQSAIGIDHIKTYLQPHKTNKQAIEALRAIPDFKNPVPIIDQITQPILDEIKQHASDTGVLKYKKEQLDDLVNLIHSKKQKALALEEALNNLFNLLLTDKFHDKNTGSNCISAIRAIITTPKKISLVEKFRAIQNVIRERNRLSIGNRQFNDIYPNFINLNLATCTLEDSLNELQALKEQFDKIVVKPPLSVWIKNNIWITVPAILGSLALCVLAPWAPLIAGGLIFTIFKRIQVSDRWNTWVQNKQKWLGFSILLTIAAVFTFPLLPMVGIVKFITMIGSYLSVPAIVSSNLNLWGAMLTGVTTLFSVVSTAIMSIVTKLSLKSSPITANQIQPPTSNVSSNQSSDEKRSTSGPTSWDQRTPSAAWPEGRIKNANIATTRQSSMSGSSSHTYT